MRKNKDGQKGLLDAKCDKLMAVGKGKKEPKGARKYLHQPSDARMQIENRNGELAVALEVWIL